jgi:NAD(P)-dependent dehydrogenase (short-subunit alcohol dehydrogenase family)
MIVHAATYNFGGLDIVVNAAGQFTAGSALDVDERRWDRLMSTNLKGTWLVSRCAVIAMRARGGGSILNIAGASGMAGVRGAAAFSASKGGVIALTRSMALDLAGERIRVNAICPGAFGGGDDAAEQGPVAPLGRAGGPGDVVGLALYLASDESSFVTGGLFPIDGGLTAGTHG